MHKITFLPKERVQPQIYVVDHVSILSEKRMEDRRKQYEMYEKMMKMATEWMIRERRGEILGDKLGIL